MVVIPTFRGLDPEVRKKLELLYGRIRGSGPAIWLWKHVLTKQERHRLGDDLDSCFSRLGTLGMWTNLRGGSSHRAIVDLAYAMKLLDSADHDRLLVEIGENPQIVAKQQQPFWDPRCGKLYWHHRVIRQARVTEHPTTVMRILNAFQEAGWPPSINSPLDCEPQSLREAVRSANRKLEQIRFHVQRSGTAIAWARS